MKFKSDVVANSGGGMDSKNFIKLEDKKSIQGVFRGEPLDFMTHWVNGKPFRCTGDKCSNCQAGIRSSFRFRLNMVVREEKALVAKIFEQGALVYEQLRNLHDGNYNLEKTFIKITRYGTGTDTTYAILPVLDKDQNILKVTPDQEKHISKVQLLELDFDSPSQQQAKASSQTEEGSFFGDETNFTEDDMPF